MAKNEDPVAAGSDLSTKIDEKIALLSRGNSLDKQPLK
jgi:hypothetical protein